MVTDLPLPPSVEDVVIERADHPYYCGVIHLEYANLYILWTIMIERITLLPGPGWEHEYDVAMSIRVQLDDFILDIGCPPRHLANTIMHAILIRMGVVRG